MWTTGPLVPFCGKQFDSYHKVKRVLNTWPSSPTPMYFLEGNENLGSCESMYTDVDNDLTFNNPKLETIQMSLSEGVD